jgi:D-glycerate 3-kinase
MSKLSTSSMAVSRQETKQEAQHVLTVKADYPAYELYTEVLRNGIFEERGKQLRLVVGKDRKVKEVHRL